MKLLGMISVVIAALVAFTTDTFAAEAEGATAATVQQWRMISASFALAIAAAVGAIAQSKSISSALEGTARNPGAGGDLRVSMIIGLALIESLVIYTFVICLIIILG
jgi:F-type H+-transporting ATPase subunit c